MEFTIVKNKNFVGFGYCFPNGKVVVNWCGEITSIVIYDSLEDVEKLHGKLKPRQSNISLLYPEDSKDKLSVKKEEFVKENISN